MNADFDVRYVAQLARLNLTPAEIETFQAQLSQVLQYVDKLSEVDVSTVEPTAHANPMSDVLRNDVAQTSLTVGEALANAPRQANDLFIVPKVIE